MELLCGREMVLKTERGVLFFIFFLSSRLCVLRKGERERDGIVK